MYLLHNPQDSNVIFATENITPGLLFMQHCSDLFKSIGPLQYLPLNLSVSKHPS